MTDNNILIDKLQAMNIACESYICVRFHFTKISREYMRYQLGENQKIKAFSFLIFTFENIARIINYITTATTDIDSIHLVLESGVVNNESIHLMCSFISVCAIRKLTLCDIIFDDATDILFIDAINKNPFIKKIHFNCTCIDNYDDISPENIKNISLSIDDMCHEKILHYLSNATHLQKLHVMSNQYNNYFDIVSLLDTITNHLSLTSLKLSYFRISGEIFKKITTMLNTNKSTTSLHLNCNFDLDTHDWKNIVDILKENHTIKVLHINGAIIRTPNQTPQLQTELHLKTIESQTKFIEFVLTIETIEKFILFDNVLVEYMITDTERICKILKNNFTIKKLFFRCDENTHEKIKKYIVRNNSIASKKLFFKTKVANLTE